MLQGKCISFFKLRNLVDLCCWIANDKKQAEPTRGNYRQRAATSILALYWFYLFCYNVQNMPKTMLCFFLSHVQFLPDQFKGIVLTQKIRVT